MLVLILNGCGSDSASEPAASQPSEPISVFDPWAWTLVEAEDDPFAAERPPVVDCGPATWGPEGGGLEVQTGACNHGAFAQAMPVGVRPGDVLSATLWYDTLDAPEPALAHVAMWLGDEILWQDTVPIPSPSDVIEAEMTIAFEAPAGTALGLHLRNHGFNSWRLVDVKLTSN